MVLRAGDILALACVIVTPMLASSASGHIIHRTGEDSSAIPEAYNEAVAFATGTTSETAWMVTAIIFIVLFVLSIIVCIYLWHLRNAKLKELRYMQNIHSGANKDNQNVWYGGGAHM